MSAGRAIRVAYFLRIPNVGDRINPSIVTAVTGRAVKCFAGQHEPHPLAIGSVMASATALSQVWGTGVMHPDLGIGTVPATNVHALRGRLSHSAMRQAGTMVGDVPLGDPGYLAPGLLGIKRSVSPKFRVVRSELDAAALGDLLKASERRSIPSVAQQGTARTSG